MEKVSWKELIKQGIFAALFVALLVYTINENKLREQDYRQTIVKLTDIVKLDLVELKGKHK